MKLKKIALVVAPLLLFGLLSSPAQAESSEETATVTMQLELPPGVTLETLGALLGDQSLTEVQFEFITDSDVITVGVATPNGDASRDRVRFAVRINLEAWAQQVTEASGDSNPELLRSINQALAISRDSLPLSGATVRVDVPSSDLLSKDVSAEEDAAEDIVARACGTTWWPTLQFNNSGTLFGDRFDTMNFKWSSSRLTNLKCYSGNAFEPDFVTNNYDGKYYLSQTMVSWSSNLPSPYWDTNASDAPEERVYTIGSNNRSGLSSTVTYSNHVQLTNGNHSSDTAKVVWQRSSYRAFEPTCLLFPGNPAWCNFADESKIEHAWNIMMPGLWTP